MPWALLDEAPRRLGPASHFEALPSGSALVPRRNRDAPAAVRGGADAITSRIPRPVRRPSDAQWQDPITHEVPVGQMCSHVPQLLGSVLRSTSHPSASVMLQSAKPGLQTPMRQLIGLPPQKTMALGTAQHCEACSHGAPTPVGTHGMLVVVVVAVVEVVEAPAAQPHRHWPLKVSR